MTFSRDNIFRRGGRRHADATGRGKTAAFLLAGLLGHGFDEAGSDRAAWTGTDAGETEEEIEDIVKGLTVPRGAEVDDAADGLVSCCGKRRRAGTRWSQVWAMAGERGR